MNTVLPVFLWMLQSHQPHRPDSRADAFKINGADCSQTLTGLQTKKKWGGGAAAAVVKTSGNHARLSKVFQVQTIT